MKKLALKRIVGLKFLLILCLLFGIFSVKEAEAQVQPHCCPSGTTMECPDPLNEDQEVSCDQGEPGNGCSPSYYYVCNYTNKNSRPNVPGKPNDDTGGMGDVNWKDLIWTTIPNLTHNDKSPYTIGEIIHELLPYIFYAAGFALLIYLILGGFQVMVSSGDPKQIAAGQQKITYAIVGFIIMFCAYWITMLAGEILDIQQIKDIFNP